MHPALLVQAVDHNQILQSRATTLTMRGPRVYRPYPDKGNAVRVVDETESLDYSPTT